MTGKQVADQRIRHPNRSLPSFSGTQCRAIVGAHQSIEPSLIFAEGHTPFRMMEATAEAGTAQVSDQGKFMTDPKPAVMPFHAAMSSLFYKTTMADSMWDTWVYYHKGAYHLYYLTGSIDKLDSRDDKFNIWDGVGMAISHDGIHWQEIGKIIELSPGVSWVGSGAVWEVEGGATTTRKFIMNFSEWRGPPASDLDAEPRGNQTIFFAESQDLIHWKRLGQEYEFRQDTRWYDRHGRWDNLWVLPRPEGGFYGYWAANPKDKKPGLGFGESPDGINWRALEPRDVFSELTISGMTLSPEIGAIRAWHGKYYALLSMGTLDSWTDDMWSHIYVGVVVGESPLGPFVPAEKNLRLLVSNSSYFCRFVETPDGLLVNHHSWELDPKQPQSVKTGGVYMAPLKRANWDNEGTLRLMWWEGNDLAKGNPVRLAPAIDITEQGNPWILNLPPARGSTFILEGVMTLPGSADSPLIGIYFEGSDEKSVAFLVREQGAVEYGTMSGEENKFEPEGCADRELILQGQVHFRLIRKGRLTEFYLNDYLMQCYCLPNECNDKVGLFGEPELFGQLTAWYV